MNMEVTTCSTYLLLPKKVTPGLVVWININHFIFLSHSSGLRRLKQLVKLEKLGPLRTPCLLGCSFHMVSPGQQLWGSWTFIWWLKASKVSIPIEREPGRNCSTFYDQSSSVTLSLLLHFIHRRITKTYPDSLVEINSSSLGGSPRFWKWMWTGKKCVAGRRKRKRRRNTWEGKMRRKRQGKQNIF